jgi:hypothetical protein
VSHFAALEADIDLDLVAFLKKAPQVAQLDVVVAIVGGRPELEFLDLDDLLLLLGRGRLFWASNLNLPKSMMRQTGGSAFGWISTRSIPASSAICKASSRSTTPTFSPSASIKRTRGTRISWFLRFCLSVLIRGSSQRGCCGCRVVSVRLRAVYQRLSVRLVGPRCAGVR